MRRAGSIALCGAALAVMITVAPSAQALSGSATDANDSEGVDFRAVAWEDTSTEIVYRVEAWENFAATPDQQVYVVIGRLEGTGPVSEPFNGGAGTYPLQCNAEGPSVGTATITREATGSATSTAANSFTYRYPRSALAACGLTGDSYTFILASNHSEGNIVDDDVPSGSSFSPHRALTHQLSPPSTTSSTSTSSTSTSSTSTSSTSTTSTTTPDATSTTSTTAGRATSAPATSSATRATPGQTLAIAAAGFAPNTQVALTFESDPVALGTVTVDAAGAIQAKVVVPHAASAGTHHIVATGVNPAGGIHRASVAVTVTASRGLPRTGTGTEPIAVLAGSLIGLGLLLTGRALQRSG